MISEWIERNSKDLLLVSGFLDTAIPVVSLALSNANIEIAGPLGICLTIVAGLNTAYLTKVHVNNVNTDSNSVGEPNYHTGRIDPPKR
jgi:hypothetical protein